MSDDEWQKARYWMLALREYTDLPCVTRTLAMAAGHLCGASDAGVFLLDESKTNLLLVASWSAQGGCREGDRRAVALDAPREPLCFCLHRGEAYHAPAASSAAARLLSASARKGRSPGAPLPDMDSEMTSAMTALPLMGGGNLTLGGVLAIHAPSPGDLSPDLETVCAYGAALLDGILREGRAGRMVRGLQHDLARLEELSEQEKTVAQTLIGESGAIRRVRTLITRAAPAEATVLLTGETGTGKEVAAAALHALSRRAAAPFVKINCAALPASLLESELFGHRRGAFSGADKDHKGIVPSADGGTLLLDEVGDLPLELQAKLLRFLQEGEVWPLGAVRPLPVDIRVIAATNRDLEAAMREGRFRPDLYHRLAAFHIALPPLRERKEDIPLLAAHFLDILAREQGKAAARPAPAAMLALCAYDFPGNVRELAACVERAVLLAGPEGRNPTAADFLLQSGGEADEMRGLAEHLAAYEAELIARALGRCEGNISRAADALRIPRSTLKSKLQRLPRSFPPFLH